MRTRPRTKFTRALKARRCGRCNAKVNSLLLRCPRCSAGLSRPKK